MKITFPDLREAERLLHVGMRVVALHPYTKQPVGEDWNHRTVDHIDENATGYGLLLEANKLCSIDPDRKDFAVIGMRALGFDLEQLMAAGVRTASTRPGSGGRSTYAAEGEISWLKFRSPETGTVIEFRAHSPNLQDTIPGVVYRTKDGEECTQFYANDKRLDDAPPLPDALFEWWERCSTDVEFLREQERIFFAAIGAKASLSISTGRTGGTLAYDAPGVRGPFNAANRVEEILARHQYGRDQRTGRWFPPSSTGAPGVRPIPGKDGLWASDHASDPLSGIFDAWVAHVTLDHDGDVTAAIAAWEATKAKSSSSEAAPAVLSPERVEDDDQQDEEILAAVMPTIDPTAFYGPLKEIVEAATANSEATRVGVALSTIAQMSLLMQSFYVPLGDERPGLNVNAIQVGQSALARKGTSGEFANRRLAPMFRERAAALRSRIAGGRAAAQGRVAAVAIAERALNSAQSRHELIRTATAESLAKATTELAQMEDRLAVRKEALDKAGKEREKVFGSKGFDMRGKTLAQSHAALIDLERQIEETKDHIEKVAAMLDDPKRIGVEMQTEIDQLEESLEKARQEAEQTAEEPEAWQIALAELADPPVTLTGVSSGEGIIEAIRDEATKPDQNGHIDPGVAEKRMLIDLSEYGSMLALMRRPGSTLSAVIRDAYDCRPLATNSRNAPVKCETPYITISAAITPAELCGLMFDPKDAAAAADNGVGNRNMYAFVRREKLVSRPQPTRGVGPMADLVWNNIARVYRECNATVEPRSTPFEFTADGAAAWDEVYRLITMRNGASENAKRLYGRFEINCRKLACILAAINGESRVSAAAVWAAYAWIKYFADTVDAVASNLLERKMQASVKANATKLWDAVESLGGQATVRDVQRTVHLKKQQMNEAIQYLAGLAPPALAIDSRPATVGNGAVRPVVWLRAITIKLVG